MAEAPPPEIKNRRSCNRVKALVTFGKGTSSFSDSADVSSHDLSPNPKRLAANTFFFKRALQG
jgi:hypothetical protein